MNPRHHSVVWMVLLVLIMVPFGWSAEPDEETRLASWGAFFVGLNAGTSAMSGEMLIPAGGRPGSGTLVDLNTDLGLQDCGTVSFVARSTILENHLVDVELFGADASGLRKAPRTFRFHNRTYIEGSRLETNIRLGSSRVVYGYKLLNLENFWIAPRIGAYYLTYSATIDGGTQEGGVTSNSRSLDATFPVLGAEWRLAVPGWFHVGLEMEGMYLGDRGYLAGLQVGVLKELTRGAVVFAGLNFRAVRYIEDNQPLNNQWSYGLAGWTAGIGFSF